MVDVVEALGPVGVGLLVALESLVPPIPSEVVLPVAGFVASRGGGGVVAMVVAATVGSVAGAWALYGLGAWLGARRLRALMDRLPLLDPTDLDRGQAWFVRHGGAAVLVGRWVPVVRSLVSVPAGVERMAPWRFTAFTLLGSAVWNTALIGAGYALGERWQDVERYSAVLDAVIYAAIAAVLVRAVVRRVRKGPRRGSDLP